MKTHSTLVFSIALNGYQHLYSKNLLNQQSYALNQGYSYVAVTKPALTLMAMECAWLKLSLMLQALRAGYDTVVYIDADADIDPWAPPVESLFERHKLVYLAHGFSGRFNSGVIIVRRHRKVKEWLENILNHCQDKVPEEDNVGWGENGHIIHFAKRESFVQAISVKWNNNQNPNLPDYIRHYSEGPMRRHYHAKLLSRVIFFGYRVVLALLKRLRLTLDSTQLHARLMQLTRKCIAYYSPFQHA